MIEGCDAETPSVYFSPDGTMICRCLICARCDKHTGNSNYGHYTRICRAKKMPPGVFSTKEFFEFYEDVPHHFCCPNDCGLSDA